VPCGHAKRAQDAKRNQGIGIGVAGTVESNGMDRFVSTFTNKIDAKGRVSVPASFRAVLERDGYTQGTTGGIYCYPSLDAPALDAGGQSLAQKIDGLLDGLPDYSDERDELSVALYGDVHILSLDQDGRIVLPEALRAHAGLSTHVTFVGLGSKFQMWEPARFEERRARAREKVHDHRRLFGAGTRLQGDGGGEGGARE
jgi:MraZ protein